ncbi:MAG TPA: hypothetical protein VNW29_06930 [Candidatus Sulfotelmatobacter sp.]|jgi:hypothetical protein|nr:hypothetical protein [Candidatus Sulfotelmatobacter sp.]
MTQENILPDSRIKTLTVDDIRQLQAIAKQKFLLSSSYFWLTIENSLEDENATMQVHKCTCGNIVLSSPQYLKECKENFLKYHRTACWHLEGPLDSIEYLTANISKRVDHIVSLLKEDVSLAMKMADGLLPVDNYSNFDYSLYKLEYAVWIQRSKFGKSSQDTYRIEYLTAFDALKLKAGKKNKIEYEKLKKYYTDPKKMKVLSESMQTALNKHSEAFNILADEAYKRVTHAFSPSTRSLKNSKNNAIRLNRELMLDAYQAFFEIKEILEIIYNFIIVINGGTFNQNPFDGKRINGILILDKKGLMIKKILEDSKDRKLKSIINKAYDSKFRNNTAGHNDYIVNPEKKVIKVKSKKISYSFQYASEKEERLIALITSLISSLMFSIHDDNIKELSLMGITTIWPRTQETDKPLPEIMSTQFWSNAQLDKNGENTNALSLKFSKDHKFLHFSHNESIPEGSFKSTPSRQLYDWLISIKDKSEISYERIIIAPKTELFLYLAKGELKIDKNDYFILGMTHHMLKVNQSKIKKIIKLLKKKNLPDLNTSTFGQVLSAVKNYKDKKLDQVKI